jgi:hypothetical protein
MFLREAITPGEVEDLLKDTLDHPTGQTADLVIVYPVPGHPLLRPDAGFIDLVRYVAVSFLVDSILDLIIVVHNPVFTSEPPIHRC